MTHLTSDELIDAMEGRGEVPHLATCEHCRRELAELSSVLAEAKQLSVPEPSPLFWQHFSERVRTAIDSEHLRLLRAVGTRPSPGSKRSMTSPSATRSQRQSVRGFSVSPLMMKNPHVT